MLDILIILSLVLFRIVIVYPNGEVCISILVSESARPTITGDHSG